VLGGLDLSLSTIFLLDFRTVATVWYFFFGKRRLTTEVREPQSQTRGRFTLILE